MSKIKNSELQQRWIDRHAGVTPQEATHLIKAGIHTSHDTPEGITRDIGRLNAFRAGWAAAKKDRT